MDPDLEKERDINGSRSRELEGYQWIQIQRKISMDPDPEKDING